MNMYMCVFFSKDNCYMMKLKVVLLALFVVVAAATVAHGATSGSDDLFHLLMS